MVGFLVGFYDHVVHVNLEHVSNFSLEDLVHHLLVCSICALPTKGNYVVLIVARLGHDGRVLLVRLCHEDLVVSRISNHERR